MSKNHLNVISESVVGSYLFTLTKYFVTINLLQNLYGYINSSLSFVMFQSLIYLFMRQFGYTF